MAPTEQNKYDNDNPYSSPRAIPYFSDNAQVHDLVDNLRWCERKICPRCKSVFIKKVNTNIFRDLQRCIDCGYMFNSLSGTIFMGAKIPLIKYLQLFTIYNARGDAVSKREISYVIDVSYKTAITLFERLKDANISTQFAFIDKIRSDRFRSFYARRAEVSASETFFAYCEMKGIVIDEEKFRIYLKELIDFEMID